MAKEIDIPSYLLGRGAGRGGGGTSDYEDLENKPKINNVELVGDLSLSALGINGFKTLAPGTYGLHELEEGAYYLGANNGVTIKCGTSVFYASSSIATAYLFVYSDTNYSTTGKLGLIIFGTAATGYTQIRTGAAKSATQGFMDNQDQAPWHYKVAGTVRAYIDEMPNSVAVKNYVDNAVANIPTITYGTTDLTPGVSTLADGTFYFCYE